MTGRSNALDRTTSPILFRPDLDVPECKKNICGNVGFNMDVDVCVDFNVYRQVM